MSDDSSEREANRFVRPLPPNPNLDKQRKLAKTLAIERVRALHPKPPTPEIFVLSDAQPMRAVSELGARSPNPRYIMEREARAAVG